MEKLRVAICEDEEDARQGLCRVLGRAEPEADYARFSSGAALLGGFFFGKYDLVLMDIYMEGMNGVETVERLRRIDKEVPIAFITSSLEHAMDGYRLHVDRYIHKPFQDGEVRELLSLARERKGKIPMIPFREGRQRVSIPIEQILYVEQNGHNVCLHATGGRSFSQTGKLDELEKLLSPPDFLRCHKSYLVNLCHVRYIDKELLVFVMEEGGNAHIRRRSLKDATKAFARRTFERTRATMEGKSDA